MDLAAEWLEADGLGGFASGTVSGERTRRYHALLRQQVTNIICGRFGVSRPIARRVLELARAA
jgi:glycogen debranching enzyme